MERSGIPIDAGDFGINRVAQRVRCVMNLCYSTSNGTIIHIGPQVGVEYTVSAFLDCVLTVPPAPGIELKEIETPVCACCGKRLSWPIFAFRPVVADETKTDISALVDAAAKVTLPDAVKAEIFDSARPIFAQGGVVEGEWPSHIGILANLLGERPGEAVMTPEQLADLTAPKMAKRSPAIVMTTAAERDDAIARAFIRAFVIPRLVKMLGLGPKQ